MKLVSVSMVAILVMASCGPASQDGRPVPTTGQNPGATADGEGGAVSGSPPAAGSGKPVPFCLKSTREPKEGAFSILVPTGWAVDGGIVRFGPDYCGAVNATGGKLHFLLKRDQAASAMVLWMPELMYIDASGTIAGQYGAGQAGTIYNNCIAMPRMRPSDYLQRVIFPNVHPRAEGLKVVSTQSLPGLAAAYRQTLSPLLAGMGLSYASEAVTVRYTEDGREYTERLLSTSDDYDAVGAGMWKNRGTVLYRAPTEEFASFLPVFAVIQSSVELNMEWLNAEVSAEAQRVNKVLEVQQQIHEIDRQIQAQHQAVRDEINKNMYLNLTDQQEFYNPQTGQIELGKNVGTFVWRDDYGNEIYTSNPDYTPSRDPGLEGSGLVPNAFTKRQATR
jgi:hypothetical protein